MCPTAETLSGEMVGVETQATAGLANGSQSNGRVHPSIQQQKNPYAPPGWTGASIGWIFKIKKVGS